MGHLLGLLCGVDNTLRTGFSLFGQIFQFIFCSVASGCSLFQLLRHFLLACRNIFQILGNGSSASLDGVQGLLHISHDFPPLFRVNSQGGNPPHH
jgi:hypothetical protein